MRRVNRNHLAGHQPVEQHADAREMLLDGRSRHALAELLYISGDMNRRDFIEPADALLLAPLEERTGSTAVSCARVQVTDIDGEEFEEAEPGLLASCRDQRGHHSPLPRRVSIPDDGQLTHARTLPQAWPQILGHNVLYHSLKIGYK